VRTDRPKRSHGQATAAPVLSAVVISRDDEAVIERTVRSVVVNRRSISHVTRAENETAAIHLRNRDDVLPVSRSYLHLFRQM